MIGSPLLLQPTPFRQTSRINLAKELAVGLKWKSDGSVCPICSGTGRGSTRYPAALCETCQAAVVDANGEQVQLYNEGF
jgi:hypothetical protein